MFGLEWLGAILRGLECLQHVTLQQYDEYYSHVWQTCSSALKISRLCWLHAINCRISPCYGGCSFFFQLFDRPKKRAHWLRMAASKKRSPVTCHITILLHCVQTLTRSQNHLQSLHKLRSAFFMVCELVTLANISSNLVSHFKLFGNYGKRTEEWCAEWSYCAPVLDD